MNLNLPTNLFWDTEFNTISEVKHAHFIIKRVVQKGSVEDWKVIKEHYGMGRLKKEIMNIRDLDKKSLSFFSLILEEPKENFRCYTTKQWMS